VRKRLSFLIVMAMSFILCAQPLHVRADDGGGDGGSGSGGDSGDGGSSDGSGTDAGTDSDSSGTDATGNSGTDDTGADGESDGDATTADAPDAPSTDPSDATDPALAPSISFAPPTDPTTAVNAETPLDAIQSIAVTDPRGGFEPVNATASGIPGDAVVPGSGPKGPVDVPINAVIVSAAQSPWDAITKVPGVRNVIVTGGIIALGKEPLDGEIPNGGPQPPWLQLIPDLRLLNGSMIPPVVPNVIDIRIMSSPIRIEDLNPE
jgi:hypothetical protein